MPHVVGQLANELILYLTISILVLPIDNLVMRLNESASLCPNVHVFQLEGKVKVAEPPLEVVAVNVHQQPDELAEYVAGQHGLHDHGDYCVCYLDRVLGSDVSVGNGSDHTHRVVHDVVVLQIPR